MNFHWQKDFDIFLGTKLHKHVHSCGPHNFAAVRIKVFNCLFRLSLQQLLFELFSAWWAECKRRTLNINAPLISSIMKSSHVEPLFQTLFCYTVQYQQHLIVLQNIYKLLYSITCMLCHSILLKIIVNICIRHNAGEQTHPSQRKNTLLVTPLFRRKEASFLVGSMLSFPNTLSPGVFFQVASV